MFIDMKAKIKATGEIVDVYHETQHGTPKMIYKESVLVNSRMWTVLNWRYHSITMTSSICQRCSISRPMI